MAPETNTPEAPRPLAGCRIVDLSTLLPGPYCTGLLASFGAEVIKVEPPTGDPVRRMNPTLFGLLNRGKCSVTLDLRQPADRDALLQLVADADILVEGFRPDVLGRLGLDLETLHARNPRLVVASISGFGWTGPYRDHPGHDIGFLALAGYFAVPSELEHRPTRPQVRLADLAAGQNAALAITMAWVQARATGRGCHVDASIHDAVAAWTAPMLLSTPITDDPAALPHVMADSALYRTADGRHLCIATLEDKFWLAFAAAVADVAPALSADRYANRAGRDLHKRGLAADLAAAIATRPLAFWRDRLEGVDTAVVPVYEGREALDDPHWRARGLVTTAADGTPELRYPARFGGAASRSLPPAPALGEHNATLIPRRSSAADSPAALGAQS